MKICHVCFKHLPYAQVSFLLILYSLPLAELSSTTGRPRDTTSGSRNQEWRNWVPLSCEICTRASNRSEYHLYNKNSWYCFLEGETSHDEQLPVVFALSSFTLPAAFTLEKKRVFFLALHIIVGVQQIQHAHYLFIGSPPVSLNSSSSKFEKSVSRKQQCWYVYTFAAYRFTYGQIRMYL